MGGRKKYTFEIKYIEIRMMYITVNIIHNLSVYYDYYIII